MKLDAEQFDARMTRLDELLPAFREAVEHELRLLDVERYIQKQPPTERRFTIAVLRLSALRIKNPRFDYNAVHRYLLALHERHR